LSKLVCTPAGHAPPRRKESVRRTSSLDATWPQGRDGAIHMEGRGRDLLNGSALADPQLLREDVVHLDLSQSRKIEAISNDRISLQALVGARGGGHLRAALDEYIHGERVSGSPLYLLLDDVSGASLVAGWAWSRWTDETDPVMAEGFEERRKFMENVCHGFATGSSALASDQPPRNNPQVVSLGDPSDNWSWHELPHFAEANFRRSRRIDVWTEGSHLHIDVGFQDSATDPELERVAIHEYRVFARADAETGVLQELSATPHILPFPECPGAIHNIQQMVGTPLTEMRTRVIEELPGAKGCTHLNDLLRGLAEAPILASYL
jgi:hypothetical protein